MRWREDNFVEDGGTFRLSAMSQLLITRADVAGVDRSNFFAQFVGGAEPRPKLVFTNGDGVVSVFSMPNAGLNNTTNGMPARVIEGVTKEYGAALVAGAEYSISAR